MAGTPSSRAGRSGGTAGKILKIALVSVAVCHASNHMTVHPLSAWMLCLRLQVKMGRGVFKWCFIGRKAQAEVEEYSMVKTWFFFTLEEEFVIWFVNNWALWFKQNGSLYSDRLRCPARGRTSKACALAKPCQRTRGRSGQGAECQWLRKESVLNVWVRLTCFGDWEKGEEGLAALVFFYSQKMNGKAGIFQWVLWVLKGWEPLSYTYHIYVWMANITYPHSYVCNTWEHSHSYNSSFIFLLITI